MTKTIRKQLGKNLKKARLKTKMTQQNVADKAGITVNYYAMIERGEVNPSLEKMRSIAKALKLKITIP